MTSSTRKGVNPEKRLEGEWRLALWDLYANFLTAVADQHSLQKMHMAERTLSLTMHSKSQFPHNDKTVY